MQVDAALDKMTNHLYHPHMLAQVSEETARTFIERLPDIIRAAATNPLGLVALIVMVLSIVAVCLFRGSTGQFKLSAFALVGVCVVTLSLVAMHEYGKSNEPVKKPDPGSGAGTGGSEPAGTCTVSGTVFNEDLHPAIGLQQVKLAYVTAAPASSQPVQVATTAPDGKFSFNCSKIKPDAFPIHLRATFAAGSVQRTIESDDQLVFGENQNVNVYLSPRATSNYYHFNAELMRIPSSQLFRKDFVTVTNAATARASTNHILVVPRSVPLSREAVTRLRMTQ
jgi:hypothetical protein